MISIFRGLLAGLLLAALVGTAGAGDKESRDASLKAARDFVEASDRYLHHSQLKRGMKGYGLSVFSGAKIEKFDVEIVSVMENFEPGQDVILAKCTGQGLEESMIVQGMSGSPVFMTDPRDGREKMIGAVAYGWSFSKEPLGGIQPITQMIAMAGVLDDTDDAQQADGQGPREARPAPAGASDVALDRRAFLDLVLDPQRGPLDKLYRSRTTMGTADVGGALLPLSTPLSVSGVRPATLEYIRKRLAPAGLVPVQGGSVGGVATEEVKDVRLEPGGTLAIPYVTGDADWVGIGTVTEIMGEKVLGFGHGMSGQGEVSLPMGTGYVHTVVPMMISSFKLGSSLRMVGTLGRDEYVGVGGRIGDVPPMVPMSIEVTQARDNRTRRFEYNLVKEWYYTGRLASILPMVSATALRTPPREHHIDYEIDVDFGEMGHYTVKNRVGKYGLGYVGGDTERPIAALMYNPLGQPVAPKDIAVRLTIREGNINARLVGARLDAEVYQPGETVSGYVTVELFRKDREKLPFTLKLPENLPDGEYPLSVGDASMALELLQADQPQYFNPRTPEQLFESVRRMAALRSDHLHVHMEVPAGSGLAIGPTALPDLPPSKQTMLKNLDLPETAETQGALRVSLESPYVLRGRESLQVLVKKHTNETPVHKD
jgi:hypothetical protein